MCHAFKCSTCGKTTWGGCGRHVASVYRQIGQGQHCLCREWPGVKVGSSEPSTGEDAGGSNVQRSASRCTIF
ncbi:hypothetical protein AAC387_Pa02g3232 [Persea americana]